MVESPSNTDSEIQLVRLGTIVERGAPLFATRLSECCLATTVQGDAQVLLWTLRHPFPDDNRLRRRFIDRLKKIEQCLPNVPSILQYGIDENGIGFVITEYVEAPPILEANPQRHSPEKLFVEIVRIVATCHRNDIFLGDISEDSFFVDEAERVWLFAILGDTRLDAKKTSSLAPSVSVHFCSPEQRDGASPSAASDVYALGVLGYRLWTKAYPVTSDTVRFQTGSASSLFMSSPPSSHDSSIPSWVDGVMGRCLDKDVGRRYHDANHLLADVERMMGQDRVKVFVSEEGQSTVEKEETRQQDRLGAINHDRWQKSDPRHGKRRKTSHVVPIVLVLFSLGVCIALGADLLWNRKSKTTATNEDVFAVQEKNAAEALVPLLRKIRDAKVPKVERVEAVYQLAEVRDPLVFETLTALMNKEIRDDAADELAAAARKAFLERLQNFGYVRTVQLLSSFFVSLDASGATGRRMPIVYHALRAAEPMGDPQVKMGALEQVYSLDPRIGLELAAAFLFSPDPPPQLNAKFREWLQIALPGQSLEGKSIQVLVLTNPSLVDLFDDLKSEFLHGLSDTELLWAAQQATLFDSPVLFLLSQEILQRNLLDRYHSVYLATLLDAGRIRTNQAIQRALVRAALGGMTDIDIQRFSDWDAPNAIDVFLTACVTEANSKRAVDAFDLLAARPLGDEPVHSLVQWVKANAWDRRVNLVRSIGILGLFHVAPEADLREAFQTFGSVSSPDAFLGSMERTNDPVFLTIAVNSLGGRLSPTLLTQLLSSPNPEVRISSIRALKTENDLLILQKIRHAYDLETDPEVRKVYEDELWVAHKK